MTFLNLLDALIPKIPFSFFPDFWVRVTSKALGSDSVGFWGSCQLSPFWGEGGVRPEGSIDPPPRKRKPRLPCHGGRGAYASWTVSWSATADRIQLPAPSAPMVMSGPSPAALRDLMWPKARRPGACHKG